MLLLTGALAFFLSSVLGRVLDDLTTVLVIGTVVLAPGRDNPRFVPLGCISAVAACNAGGAFSPFDDITTLMVWQAGKLSFFKLFALFAASVSDWMVPAAIMVFAIPNEKPPAVTGRAKGKPGLLQMFFY